MSFRLRRLGWATTALLAGAAGLVSANETPPLPPPQPSVPPWVPKVPVEAEIAVGECEPYTQDDSVVVERLADGGLRVSQCLVGYGESIPEREVRVIQHGERLRISFLDHSRPFEPNDPVPGCSSTRRLVVTVGRHHAKVTTVSVEGWRVQSAGVVTAKVDDN